MQASARLASSAASRRVIAGISSTITRSCYRTTRGKAHAAPLSAQEPPPKQHAPKGEKRISKHERRVRIEEFVEKYRASNEGKFPTITNVRQNVGGGHYTIREILQELEYNHANPHLDNVKTQLQETAEFAKHSRPKNEPKLAQVQGVAEWSEHSKPKDVDDVTTLLKDATKSSEIIEKTETRSVDSSHYNVETEAAKQGVNTSETFKSLSDQTATEKMRGPMSEPFISLGVEAKSRFGNQEVETEADKLDLNDAANSMNGRKQTVSDQTGSGKVIKANVLDREQDPKHKLEESTNTGLFWSLKSFAYGIRNFWNKL